MSAVARSAGSIVKCVIDPGARAPGFMLAPASRAKRTDPAVSARGSRKTLLHELAVAG